MRKTIILLASLFILSYCSGDETNVEEDLNKEPHEWRMTHTISDLFEVYGNTEVKVDTIAIVGVVISSDESDNIKNELYIQDETGALVISIEKDDLFLTYPIGTEILVKCPGLFPDVSGRRLTLPGGSAITNVLEDEARIILTGDEVVVTPVTVNFSTITEEYLNQYIRFTGFQFAEDAVGKTFIQNNSRTTWVLSNADEVTVSLVFEPGVDFAADEIPDKAGLVQGLYVKEGNDFVLKVNSIFDLHFSSNRRAPFVKKEFEFGENTLPYQIMFPRDYDKSNKYPLVVFLHGAGERGTNNTSQMAFGPNTFGSYEARTNYPAIVIFPQCPANVQWARTSIIGSDLFFPVEDNPNYVMEMVIELVRILIEEEGVDNKRIYLSGLSMGGFGLFEFLYYAPDLPAVIASLAGAYDPNLVNSFPKEVEFRLYHGSNDPIVPVRYSREMYSKLNELGYNAEYYEAEGRGHEWNYVLEDPEYIEWLFSQVRE